MAKFTSIESKGILLPVDNIDTDQIIPARFLKVIDKEGLGKHLFSDWRYLPDGNDNPDFVINRPASQGASLLIAGDNFGCGSSREHAPWALMAWGFRAIVSTSFADIFRSNSLKNGLLPVELDAATHQKLIAQVQASPEAPIRIDLATRTLTLPDGSTATFPIDSFSQHCLLNGLDQLGYILSFSDRIEQYEQSSARP